jgi:hypothetical protein
MVKLFSARQKINLVPIEKFFAIQYKKLILYLQRKTPRQTKTNPGPIREIFRHLI